MSYNASVAMQEAERKLRAWQTQYDQRGTMVSPIVYSGYITGLTHHDYAKYSRFLRVEDQLYVRADPDNKYDTNATGLFYRPTGCTPEEAVQIGWIPKALNRVAAQAIRDGYLLRATLTAHRPSSSNPNAILECRVTIYGRASHSIQPATPTKEQQTMKTAKAILEQNINLGTSAAFLEAGRIANNQLSSIAGKKLPIMVRAYADTPMGRLLLANVALMAREHFRPNDERLSKLCNAMAVSAYQEVLQSFDIEQMIEDLVENKTIAKALKTFDAEPAKTSIAKD